MVSVVLKMQTSALCNLLRHVCMHVCDFRDIRLHLPTPSATDMYPYLDVPAPIRLAADSILRLSLQAIHGYSRDY
jgi:hypothetical protein